MNMSTAMLKRMQAGAPALGVGLRQARTVDIGRAMVTAGADWLFIDMEHNSMHLDTAVQIAVDAIDRLHTTAESHHRVLIVEVMACSTAARWRS